MVTDHADRPVGEDRRQGREAWSDRDLPVDDVMLSRGLFKYILSAIAILRPRRGSDIEDGEKSGLLGFQREMCVKSRTGGGRDARMENFFPTT